MAGLTLGTQRDLTNDMLVKGLIDSIVTVNQFYQALPFKGIEGNALAYTREGATDPQTLVDVLNTGAAGINKNPQTFTRHNTELTTIIGDAQVNGLIQAVGSDYNDATAIQVATKAKGVGRKFMDLMINGNEQATTSGAAMPADINTVISADVSTLAKRQAASLTFNINNVTYTGALTSGSAGSEVLTANGAAAYNAASVIANGYTGFDGLGALVTAGNTMATKASGTDILDYLDVMIDSVSDKDGMIDYIMMSSAGVREFTKGIRANGASAFDTVMEVKNSSGGVMKVQAYRGVPIYRNDFISGMTVYAGTLDDGSMQHGISGLTAKNASGLQVQKLGAREDVDADITRVKWYCGLANFSELGLVKGQLA